MAEITLDDFRANVREVARPNRFLMSIPSPPFGLGGFDFTEAMQYHVRTAALPGRSLGDISNQFWFGMNHKVAGDPSYDDINVSFLNNVNFNLKELFEKWVDFISPSLSNQRATHLNYKAVVKMDQIGRHNNVVATYFLHGCWPKSLEPVELSQESTDQLEEFVVTLSLDYWSNNESIGKGEGIVLKGKTISA